MPIVPSVLQRSIRKDGAVPGDALVDGSVSEAHLTSGVATKLNNGVASFIRRHSFATPFSYCGIASVGTTDSGTTWKITRINIATNGTVVTAVATGAWTNRASLNYI